MPPTALASPQKNRWSLVQFVYGAEASQHVERFVDRPNDYVDGQGNTWLGQPAMEISEIERAIALEEKPVTIKMPITIAFVDRISSGEPHAPVEVTIQEAYDDGLTVKTIFLFVGDVSRTVRNCDGHMALASIECIAEKAQYGIPMGIIMDAFCPNTFGGPGCFKDLAPLKQTVVLDNILPSGKVVHFDGEVTPTTGDGAVPLKVLEYWARGYVEYDGLRILIRDARTVVAGGETPTLPVGNWWILAEEPPASWLGKTVVITPGCNKLPKRCDEWLNLEHFAGSGHAMPAFHPNLETQ